MPGATIKKDPTVTIASDSKPAYIFVQAKKKANSVLSFNVDGAKWTVIDAAEGIYAYGTADAMTKMTANQQATLFNEVTVSASATGTIESEDIVVTAYAIQADNLNVTKPADVWALIK